MNRICKLPEGAEMWDWPAEQPSVKDWFLRQHQILIRVPRSKRAEWYSLDISGAQMRNVGSRYRGYFEKLWASARLNYTD